MATSQRPLPQKEGREHLKKHRAEWVRRSVASAAMLSALAAAIMTALRMLCMRPLLTLMHTPAAAWILADILLLTAYPIVLRQQEAAHRGDRPAAQPLPQRA